MTTEEFSDLALSFSETVGLPHFDRTAFKVIKRRIFATLDHAGRAANIKLNEVDQSVFCAGNRKDVYAVPNKWGKQGWTTFELDYIPVEMVTDALNTAYNDALKKNVK